MKGDIKDSMVDNLSGTDYNSNAFGLESESSAGMYNKLLTSIKELVKVFQFFPVFLGYSLI